MQRDGARGLSAYELAGTPREGRRPVVRVLEPADPGDAVTVAEQELWYRDRLADRRAGS